MAEAVTTDPGLTVPKGGYAAENEPDPGGTCLSVYDRLDAA